LEFQALDHGREFDKYGLWTRWRQEGKYGRLLATAVRQFRPGVVFSANTPVRSQAMLLSAARRHGARFVFWVQDVLGVGITQALRRRLGPAGVPLGWFIAALERRVWRQSDHAVVISDDFLRYMPARAGGQHATVIPNWAPLDELPLVDPDNPWAREHGLNGRSCFIYTGTLGLKHNPALLGSLARRLKELDPSARVVVLSEGAGADYLRSLKLDNLLVMGFQPFNRMGEVLASATVLVALLEPDAGAFAVPSKVLTYLCAGRALLLAVPRANLARRTVELAGAGLCADPGDERQFFDAAWRLLQDAALRHKLASRAREFAEHQFDIRRIADRFEELLCPIESSEDGE